VDRRASVLRTIEELAVMSLLDPERAEAIRAAGLNCAPDAPPMPGHRSDKRGHRLRTLGEDFTAARMSRYGIEDADRSSPRAV
jgi:hypothetical protein